MSSKQPASHQLYADVPLPPGSWWRSASAAREYSAAKKTLEVARRSQSLDTVVAYIKTRQHKLITRKNIFDVSPWLSFGLGLVMATGVALVSQMGNFVDLGLFLILLSFFHMWEFTYVSYFHSETLSYESFLLTHSREFQIAMTFAFLEYFVEWYFFPWMKGNVTIYLVAFAVAVAGQLIRTSAMYTGGVSFHHMVQDEKADNHVLLDKGIYAIWRHPSYFGWFYWSIFTQVLLQNPISVVGFTFASWKFFADRIPDEEEKLADMFGPSYVAYCKKTPIRMPFIPSKY